MAISLPDARQLSDEVLQALRLRALRGCELGYTEIEVAELLGLSRETVSRWWTAYADQRPGGPPRRPHRPPGRLRPHPQRRAGGTAADDPRSRKQPRGGGDPLPVVDPQGRRRVDPQGVRDRHAGADRRRVPQAVGLHGQGAAPSLPRIRTPRRSAIGWRTTYPAIERRAAREGAEIHWCDETGAAADQQPRRGYAREGRPGEDRGARLRTSG